MLEEEVIVKSAKNSNESLLIINTLIMIAMPALLFGGNCNVAAGLFIALGIVAPLNVLNYKRTWVDARAHTNLFYTIALAPCIISFAVAAFGIIDSPFWESDIGSRGYLSLQPARAGIIVSGALSSMGALMPELATISAAACALSLFFVTESRYIIRRIFFFASLFAAAIAVFGFIYSALESIPRFMLPSFGRNAFGTFSDASQWSAFAILWLGASMTVAAYSSQRFRIFTYLYSLKFFSFSISVLLFLSVIFCGKPIDKIFAMVLTAFGCAVLFFDTIPTRANMTRHWTSKYIHGKYKKMRLSVPAIFYALISVFLFAWAASMLVGSAKNPQERVIATDGAEGAVSFAERMAVYEDCKPLLDMKPIFGWGTGSFTNVFAFKQGADLGDAPYATPFSDLLQKLVENGYFGLILTFLTPAFLFLRWLYKRDFSLSGSIIFMSAGLTLVLGVF